MEIIIRRIWPAPRWPLIHEGMKILRVLGEEAFGTWLDNLSPEEKIAFFDQFSDLMTAAAARVIKDIQEGR